MSRLPLNLCVAALVAGALANSHDNQFEGTWQAVKITLMKNATKDQAAEESNLGYYSIELKPHHRAMAQFIAPLDCTWSVKGSTLKLRPREIHSSSAGTTTDVSFPPIFLTLSHDGKTLTRTFDGRIIKFQKAK